MIDIVQHNREAWNKQASNGCRWSIPVSHEVIEKARKGDWQIILTPVKPVPKSWFPSLKELNILGLAASGGQQAPVLAAAGANVTVIDNSPEQLAKDKLVAQREGLNIKLEQGDMADLSRFDAAAFDMVVHPVSNPFVQDVHKVWNEVFRVLKPGGTIISGMMNPVLYVFDENEDYHNKKLIVRHKLPYSDTGSLTPEELNRKLAERETLSFSHTLEDLIGGQISAGFSITGFYEDYWDDEITALNKFMPTSFATRALKI